MEGTNSVTNAGCIECYRQLMCRRIFDISAAMGILWNCSLQVPAIIQARVILETLISLNHFVKTTENIVAHHGPQALQDHVTKAVFSTRDKEKAERNSLGQATNILTQIGKFPESIAALVKQHYEQVSDYCHPNGYAMLQSYGDLIDFKFFATPRNHKAEQTFVAIQNACMCIICAEDLMILIDDILMRVRDKERFTPGKIPPAG